MQCVCDNSYYDYTTTTTRPWQRSCTANFHLKIYKQSYNTSLDQETWTSPSLSFSSASSHMCQPSVRLSTLLLPSTRSKCDPSPVPSSRSISRIRLHMSKPVPKRVSVFCLTAIPSHIILISLQLSVGRMGSCFEVWWYCCWWFSACGSRWSSDPCCSWFGWKDLRHC